MDRKTIPNPFEIDVVTDPERPAPADVPIIHKEAFDRCCIAYERVAEQRRSWSVLLHGEAGCGKTHLLSRFKNWLSGAIAPKPTIAPALFVAVRMETGPGYVWRHLRRRFAEELTRRLLDGQTPLDAILDRFAQRANGNLDDAFDQFPVADLGLDLVRVLEHFAAGRHRRLCRSWLAGDALTEVDHESLNVVPPTTEDIEEDLAESDSRRVVLAVTRLCAPLPVVFCFDQIEALGLSQQNKSYGAFTRMGASLIDATENSLVVSTVLASFLKDLEDGSFFTDFQRISKEQVDLQPLDWDLGHQLVAARLALVPELGGENPIRDADLRAFYQSQHGRSTPRRLIHEARKLFDLWRNGAESPHPSIPEFLATEFERLWTDSPARSNPAETDQILAHGLPVLLQLLGHKTRERPARSIDLATESGGSKLWLAYGNHADMRSFSPWLRRISENEGSDPICIVRDARIPIKTGAKAAQQRLDKIVQSGGRLVRVEAEALAALDAMRRLVAQATSGDLSIDGETITTQTVREWLAENLPRDLAQFTEDLLGKSITPQAEPLDALMDLLRARKVISLEEAVRLSRVPQEQIETYARTHPDHIGWFGGPRPVVCQSVAPLMGTQGGGAHLNGR